MPREVEFATEAAMVEAFVGWIEKRNAGHRKNGWRRDGGDPSTWTIYHETGGYDLILVEDQTGVQVGIEAKLALNLKVINQVLPSRYDRAGPDYRAVLVPKGGMQRELDAICNQIGIVVLMIYDSHMRSSWHDARGIPHKPEWYVTDGMPDERSSHGYSMEHWHAWLPIERVALPDYVPDVVGGKPSPLALTDWKIRAIKLMVVLEKRGHVTRKDMKALELSPTRWTAASYGYLVADKSVGGYVASTNTPDLRAQHPRNYAEIEADYAIWSAAAGIVVD